MVFLYIDILRLLLVKPNNIHRFILFYYENAMMGRKVPKDEHDTLIESDHTRFI